MLKVFEYCLTPTLSKHLSKHCNQFGLRSGSSCLSVVTDLRETIFRYVSEGSKVLCEMVDMSKAFDQINHNVLLKLNGIRETSLPEQVIGTLGYILNNTVAGVVFKKI